MLSCAKVLRVKAKMAPSRSVFLIWINSESR
jgi:hypothetical protein